MKPAQGEMGATSVVLYDNFTRTEWGTHSTENSRVGTPVLTTQGQGSSSCGRAAPPDAAPTGPRLRPGATGWGGL
eukprot:7054866-Prymnesium_polylepis.1